MDYQGNIIRPPSEANSIILQVTTGCSHNSCTFCGAYRDKPFQIKPLTTIQQDLRFAANHCRRQQTLFLADGDALALPHEQLCQLLAMIKEQLPWVRRVSSYASCRNIIGHSDQELAEYQALGLRRLYLGLESGHDPTLKAICKGVSSKDMVTSGRRISKAGLFLSVTCLLGIAGSEHSQEHARATAAVLNQMQPNQAAVLTLMVLPGTLLERRIREGAFIPVNRLGLFKELHMLLSDLQLQRSQFQANHASNYFSLNGRLPRDKQDMLAIIDSAISGELTLVPEACRRL